jgi:hypothetical protein
MYMNISVRVSKHDFDAGIGIVCYVHSLIGFAGNTITKKMLTLSVKDFFQVIKNLLLKALT